MAHPTLADAAPRCLTKRAMVGGRSVKAPDDVTPADDSEVADDPTSTVPPQAWPYHCHGN
ncbi:hypothetical protein DY467_04610 [Rhodopseudomonas sp. BR0G17]|nr:hypothetical protein [Rhodopseudomonas sp. BR0G17]